MLTLYWRFLHPYYKIYSFLLFLCLVLASRWYGFLNELEGIPLCFWKSWIKTDNFCLNVWENFLMKLSCIGFVGMLLVTDSLCYGCIQSSVSFFFYLRFFFIVYVLTMFSFSPNSSQALPVSLPTHPTLCYLPLSQNSFCCC